MDPNYQPTETTNDKPQQLSLLDLEAMTVKNVSAIDQKKDELKRVKEMFEDTFNNDPRYVEQQNKVKEVRRQLLAVRQELAKQPSVAALEEQVKDLGAELKEQKDALSTNAMQYAEASAADHIEIKGVLYKIVKTAKLVKAKQ